MCIHKKVENRKADASNMKGLVYFLSVVLYIEVDHFSISK